MFEASDVNFSDQAGARLLKFRIESYWRERGYDVHVQLVAEGFNPAMRCAYFNIRSDMKNGIPARKIDA